ncbi:FUN14 domain-containing protein [Deinococcus sp. YIM 134068]|uniref:FUN14 domain-containing protein n=1 Tax=Deinococcus lichenicola TaxID=3118910 RepID=UPI002F956070
MLPDTLSTAPLAHALHPLLPGLSVGTLLGFATGLALRKLGRVVLVALGLLVLAVQLLAFHDLLTVNWTRVQSLAEPLFQRQEGGAWLLDILTARLPFAGGFTAGLLVGLRKK